MPLLGKSQLNGHSAELPKTGAAQAVRPRVRFLAGSPTGAATAHPVSIATLCIGTSAYAVVRTRGYGPDVVPSGRSAMVFE